MRMRFVGLVAVSTAGLLGLAACGSSSSATSSTATSSAAASSAAASSAGGRRQGRRDPARHASPRPAGRARTGRCSRPGVRRRRRPVRHPERAGRRRQVRRRIADSMINEGVKVLMIVNLDSDSGAAVLKKAKAAGHPDHRLRPPDPRRRRDVLRVVRQRRRSAQLQGEGLRQVPDGQRQDQARTSSCSTARRPTTTPRCSSRATTRSLKPTRGYTSRRRPDRPGLGRPPGRHRSSSRSSPRPSGKIDGVVVGQRRPGRRDHRRAARSNGLAGKVPVTGQDATRRGPAARPRRQPVHDRLQGRSRRRPTRRPTLAIALVKGDKAGADALATGTVKDTEANADVPSVLLEPAADLQGQRQGRHRRRLHQGREDLHRRVRRGLHGGRHQLTSATAGPVRARTPGAPSRVTRRPGAASGRAPPGRPHERGLSTRRRRPSRHPAQLRGINKSFGAVHVLHDVDLDVYAGRGHRARRRQRRRQVAR